MCDTLLHVKPFLSMWSPYSLPERTNHIALIRGVRPRQVDPKDVLEDASGFLNCYKICVSETLLGYSLSGEVTDSQTSRLERS